MANPMRDTIKMSSAPLVVMTPTSSSPSRRLMAMKPSRRDLSYSEKVVFLTWPALVAKSRYRSVGNSLVSMRAWMRSSGSSGSRLTMAVPRAVRSLRGTS